MRANVAQETEEQVEHAFNVTTSFSIADITANANPADPSKRVEIYDSGASCHTSPYIDAFTDFAFIEPKPVSAADNRTFNTVGKGTIVPFRLVNNTDSLWTRYHMRGKEADA